VKAVKPLRLSFLHRTFEHERRVLFVPTIIALFPFESPKSICSEVELWKMVGAELGKFVALDQLMWKSQGELLVSGACFPAGGKPAPSAHVRTTLGGIDKTLYVFGDRNWSLLGPSDPAPFTKMPLDWEHAFGGEKYPQNPIGKGLAPQKTESGTFHPLPNVEDPKKIVKAKGDKPPPASLGPMDITWPHVFAKMGTYDEKWRKEQFPGFALDIDFSMFNVALPDQRIEGYFRGDEAFRVENMHPDKPVLESRLPAVVARCFLKFTPEHGGELVEVPMHIDTVHLFPHLERGLVIFRGLRTTAEPDASDIAVGMAGLEDLGDEPKPLSHYETVLEQRLDKKKAHLYVLRDVDLMPRSMADAPKVQPVSHDAFDDIMKMELPALENARRRTEKEMKAARERAIAMGADPASLPETKLEPFVQPSLDELPRVIEMMEAETEKAKAEAERQKAEAEKKARALCAKNGVDYDAQIRKGKRESAGPPKFSADKELEKQRDLAALSAKSGVAMPGVAEKLADPEYEKKLRAAEKALHDAYRMAAHGSEGVPLMEPEESARAREEILRAYAVGMKVGRRDFSGADLSGIDLSGADLEEAYFEGAKLAGANLTGANLDRAVLAHADLTGAKLGLASMREANLGRAKLEGADFHGADLSGATLYETNARGAKLTGARLDGAFIMQLVLEGADLTGARGEKMMFLQSKLAGAIFDEATLPGVTFLESDLSGCTFKNADLSKGTFLTVNADGAVFDGAKLENLRVVHGSTMERASFRGAEMKGSNLRATKLAGADFSGATISRSDLSATDLSGATFERTIAVDSRFVGTDLRGAKLPSANLMLGIFHRAKLAGADFTGANLFAADLLRAVGDDETRFTGANVKRVVRSPEAR
jgi:uncharacterized protein YjbI with pentapeptide repeats